jgi:hypothetical protein
VGPIPLLRISRDGAESTTRSYAGSIALFLRWCARSGRTWQAGAGQLALFMSWLQHAGPAASGAGADAAGGMVLAGPGAAPARSARRVNAVLTAVRGMVVHAVAAGQADGHLLPAVYEVAARGDLPGAARGDEAGMSWRMRARHRLHEPDTHVDRASDAQIVAVLRACRSARDRLLVLLMARAGLRRGEALGCPSHLRVPAIWAEPSRLCSRAEDHAPSGQLGAHPGRGRSQPQLARQIARTPRHRDRDLPRVRRWTLLQERLSSDPAGVSARVTRLRGSKHTEPGPRVLGR